MKNLEKKIKLGARWKNPMRVSMNVMPENYFITKQVSPQFYSANNPVWMATPLVNFKVKF